MTGPDEQAPVNPITGEPLETGPQKVTAADGHVYHKSATANASTAPTNEHTVKMATKTQGLSQDQIDFVTIIHYEYSLQRQIPTADFLLEEYGYEQAELETYFTDKSCVAALEERGITINAKQLAPVGIELRLEAAKASKHAPKLTPLQLVVANMLLDLSDNRSESKKLKDCGVTTSKFNMWLKDPEFAGYLKDRAEGMLGETHHEALLALMDKVRAGDTKALSMYFEMTGRFVSQTSSNAGATSSHDLQGIIIRIIEIILDEVDDPAVAVRISERLKSLATGAQVAGVLSTPDPVVVPEIAAARTITPEVQDLMNKGVGYNS